MGHPVHLIHFQFNPTSDCLMKRNYNVVTIVTLYSIINWTFHIINDFDLLSVLSDDMQKSLPNQSHFIS